MAQVCQLITSGYSYPLLYELNYEESLTMDRYPEESSQVKMGTVAYHAERELDTLMYQDTGMYRNMQYGEGQR